MSSLTSLQRREIRRKVENLIDSISLAKGRIPQDELIKRAYMLAKYVAENPKTTKPKAQELDSRVFLKVFGTIKTLREIAGIHVKERRIYRTKEEKDRAYLSMLVFVHEYPEYANSHWIQTTEYYGIFTHYFRGNYAALREKAQVQISSELMPKRKKAFRVAQEDNQTLLKFLWYTRSSDDEIGITYQECIDAGLGAELKKFYSNNLTSAFKQAKELYEPKQQSPTQQLESLLSQPQISPLPKSP